VTPSVGGTSTAGAPAGGAAVPLGGDLSLVAEGEDVDMMADVAAIAGSEGDPLKRLEDALSPIEKYAVRLIEEVCPRHASAFSFVSPLTRMLFTSLRRCVLVPCPHREVNMMGSVSPCGAPAFSIAPSRSRLLSSLRGWVLIPWPY
jgi:hypothetical protein